MTGRTLAGMLLAAAALAGPRAAVGSECAYDSLEVLTLVVREVVVDGEPAEDIAAWDLPAELARSSYGVDLTIGLQTTVFSRVDR